MHRLIYCLLLPLIVVMAVSCNFTVNGDNPPEVDDPDTPDVPAVSGNIHTPYPELFNTEEFLAGATYELPQSPSEILPELREAKEKAYVNTVTVYGLENASDAMKDALFSALETLDMKIAVRIESYDSSFAFSAEDAVRVRSHYAPLIGYLAEGNHRERVAYLAVNMPVDDGKVQNNAGGLNTQAWINSQIVYSSEIIRLLGEEMAEYGMDLPMYLSVFYGWNNDFQTPSYRDSGADGYFMNNYSYPIRGYDFGAWSESKYEDLPSVSWTDSDIINAPRLSKSMETYKRQYMMEDGTLPPLVMEWGIHTAEHNDRKPTQQSAGLVQDIAAKDKALRATYSFYRDSYDFVEGFMYFGYNLYKAEGSDNAIMDWCLRYSEE